MKYYLIGIKGSGMSALATILKQLGNEVVGSDVTNTYFTDKKLIDAGIEFFGFNPNNLDDSIDCVIIGNAFDDSNEEVVRAKELGLNTCRYYEFVNKLACEYNSIAICGTNGKTTTTGMTNSILPSEETITLIGDGTGRAGSNPKYFLFEACEYKNTFLNYHPHLCLITNIEMDHPDFFKDVEDVINSYQMFANQSKQVIVNGDDNNCVKIKHEDIITFGMKNRDVNVFMDNINLDASGATFNIIYNNQDLGQFNLAIFGEHMLYNALASITIGLVKGMDINTVINNLGQFNGVSRRFNIITLDEDNNVYLIDDYAHHPTSIKLTIQGIRQKYPNYSVTVLFQAHTYSRVNTFAHEFCESLLLADYVYIDDIFGSIREQSASVGKEVMIKELQDMGGNVILDVEDIKKVDKNHIIAVLGAGDIDTYMIPKIKEIMKG